MTTVTILLWSVLAGLLAVLLVVILLQALTISHQRAVMRWRTARLAENPKGAPKLVKRWTYEDDCYERGDLPIPEAPPLPPKPPPPPPPPPPPRRKPPRVNP